MNDKKKTAAAQEDLNGMSLRRRQEMQEQQETKKKNRTYLIVGSVIAVLVAALLIWDSGLIQRMAPAYTTAGKSYTVNDVNYHFYNGYNSMASYASYYGLDTSVSLKEQEMTDGTTWYDYLLDSALGTLDNVALLAQQARAEGYTISEDGQATIDAALENIKTTAATYGLSESSYLTYAFGRYMTPGDYKKAVTEQALAQDYAEYKTESFEISREDLDSYYAENSASLDTFDYEAYLVPLGLAPEYDEEGMPMDYDPDALAGAQELAKASAQALYDAVNAGDAEGVAALVAEIGASDVSDLSSASLSYYAFGSWLAEEGRASGDITMIDAVATDSQGESYTNGYYVVKFNDRSLDEYHNANMYNMLIQAQVIPTEETEETETSEENPAVGMAEPEYDWTAAETEINALVEQWQAEGGSAEAMLAMAQENSDGSTTEYTSISKGSQNAEVNEWLFETEHQVGDYAVIKDETLHGYRLVYFTGYDELLHWESVASNAMKQERYNSWMDSVSAELAEPESTSMMKYVYR